MKLKSILIFLAVCPVFSSYANEADHAYLDAPYENLIHPVNDLKNTKSNFDKSDVMSLLKFQSSVKSQGSRGTCSIFSATAMAEAMLKISGKVSLDEIVDLSEEWLEFLAIASTRSTTDGSYSSKNFDLIFKHGMAHEKTLHYETDDWTTSFWGLSQERCSHLVERDLSVCKLAHFDPSFYSMSQSLLSESVIGGAQEFLSAKKEALKFKKQYLMKTPNVYYNIYSVSEVKALLKSGVPVTVGMDFFYGAWNHRKANDLGIGRDLKAWEEGVVGYPEKLSMDYAVSRKSENRAGHSILVVGFDDTKIVETSIKMNDGTIKKFTYQGVYYFKNSWGTDSFGRNQSIEDESFPGYGQITQAYANEYGSFYRFPLK